MRISTSQIYQQGVDTMQRQQQSLQETELQIATGLRIMKPSDDPSGAVKVLNLTSNIDAINQFSRNVSVAQASLGLEESVVTNISTNLQRIRELVVQGNNSTNPTGAKQSIAQEIGQRLDELVAMANTRDAAGEHIFAGYKVGSPPFVKENGVITYKGDDGQRKIQIGEGSQVSIRDSGRELFLNIPAGDGNIQLAPAANNNGTAVIGEFGLTGNFVPDSYTISFTNVIDSSSADFTIRDGLNNVVTTGVYREGNSIFVAGAQFTLSGMPAAGDSFVLEPSQDRSVFETIQGLADALSVPANNGPEQAEFHNAMALGLADLDQALDKVLGVRAGIGARLNNIETIETMNQDFKLHLETALSDTQDLDFAEAIARFNLQLTSLQAAQQAFVKTSNLSLFQYL